VRTKRLTIRQSASVGVCWLLLAGACAAAEPLHVFSIPQKSYRDALIDLALQADVSLLGASACGTSGRAGLSGRHTLDQALARLLARAPCSYRIVDARMVRILPSSPTPREAPHSASAVTELLVTATKRSERPDRLAAGVSVVTHDQIELTRAADASGIAGQVAGVITTNLGPGRDKLLIRGLSDGAFTGRARSTVGTYLDDAPINYDAPDPDLRLTDIERVEVVRGPQGALYGAGSLSGVYRIVTRKPELDHAGGELSAGQAWTQGGSASGQIDGFINAPLIKGRAAVRLVGYYDQQGGYLDDVRMRLSNVDRTLRTGGRAAVRIQPNDSWLIDLGGAIQRLKSNDTQYVTPMLGPRRRANRVREAHDNDFAQGALSVRGEFSGLRLTSSTAFVRHTYSSQYDASAALDLFSARGSELGLFSETTRVEMTVQDLVLSSAGERRLGWLVGANVIDTIAKTPSVLRVRPTGGNLITVYEEQRRDRFLDIALYGEASYRLGSNWTVAAGARLFSTRIRTASSVTAPMPGVSRSLSQRHTYSGVSPKLSLQRDLGANGMIYALVSEGYRAGGLNTAGLTTPTRRPTFAPDRLRNYEIGLKARLPDRRMSVRASLFNDIWTNIQTDQYFPSGLAYTANVGDARIRGLEAEVSRDWDFGLSLHAALLAVSSKITRADPAFEARLANGLPGTPRFSGGMLAIYRRSLGGGLGLRLVGEMSYVGRSSLTFDPTVSPRMGDYLKTRLAAEIGTRRWTAGVSISNPTNASGDTFAYGNPFSFGQVRQVTPQRPRTISGYLSAAF